MPHPFIMPATKKFIRPQWVSFLLLVVLALGADSCNSEYTVKPRGYFKIDFPQKQYRLFDQPNYPYSFEYPVYANVVKDSSFFGKATENPWWINLDFPQFNSKVHISYKQIGKNEFDKLITDAYTMTNKHTLKANRINDSLMETPNNVHGVYFTVGGNVATANQFFLTDSTRHFLRGALYFDATPNEDSLGVVNRYIQEDVRHLINTFKWK